MFKPTFTLKVTLWDKMFLTITCYVQGRGRIEFRGDSYWQWQWSDSPLRGHDDGLCWSQLLHDALEGWHSCIFHTGDEAVILPKHPDYPAVERLVHWAETLTDREVITLIKEARC